MRSSLHWPKEEKKGKKRVTHASAGPEAVLFAAEGQQKMRPRLSFIGGGKGKKKKKGTVNAGYERTRSGRSHVGGRHRQEDPTIYNSSSREKKKDGRRFHAASRAQEKKRGAFSYLLV